MSKIRLKAFLYLPLPLCRIKSTEYGRGGTDQGINIRKTNNVQKTCPKYVVKHFYTFTFFGILSDKLLIRHRGWGGIKMLYDVFWTVLLYVVRSCWGRRPKIIFDHYYNVFHIVYLPTSAQCPQSRKSRKSCFLADINIKFVFSLKFHLEKRPKSPNF